MAEQKAQSDTTDESVSVKDRVAAAKRTNKDARDFFELSSDEITNMEI